jgi:hypothetical protein
MAAIPESVDYLVQWLPCASAQHQVTPLEPQILPPGRLACRSFSRCSSGVSRTPARGTQLHVHLAAWFVVSFLHRRPQLAVPLPGVRRAAATCTAAQEKWSE